MQYKKKSVQILSNSDSFFFFFSYFYLFSFDTLFLPVDTLVVNVWKVVTFTSLCNTELTVVLVVVICIFFKCWCVDAHFWGNFWPIGKTWMRREKWHHQRDVYISGL